MKPGRIRRLKFSGAIPEKNYVMIRRNGEIKQSEESIQWESKIKNELADTWGWTSKTDPELGEYTPLQLDLKIYTPKKTVLIKQIKALLDALTDIIFSDDCCIVDLTAERIYSTEEYARLTIQPADKENITFESGPCVILDRHIFTIKNNVWDEAGYPLKTKEYEKDKELRDYIRTEFSNQQLELIDGEFEMSAVFGRDIPKELPLADKMAWLAMDKFDVRRPDADNCAYQILTALKGIQYDKPEDLKKIHLTKTYTNPELGQTNKVWLKQYERN